MLNLIQDLPSHIQEASAIFKDSNISKLNGINNLIITGLGGSGIGGTIASEIASSSCSIPILVNNSYHLPAFVNERTLVIACSYSGNTEETLMCFGQAQEMGAQISVITSGGILLDKAKESGLDHVIIPGGNPPRSMLGYSLSVLLLMFDAYGIVSIDAEQKLLSAARLLENEQDSIKLNAKELASKTKNNIPVTYACAGFSGVATRWRQQFNENAKLPGWNAEVPEMNHNELVGWTGGSDAYVVYFLRSTDDFWRNQKRIEIVSEIIRKQVPQVYDIWTQGTSLIEQVFYLIHLGDWISYYLSEERGVDIVDIKDINYLKSELSKI
jgi:glucose/mannose-6-phosphate isomerase